MENAKTRPHLHKSKHLQNLRQRAAAHKLEHHPQLAFVVVCGTEKTNVSSKMEGYNAKETAERGSRVDDPYI
jgi:hypothetical protein